MDEKFVYNVDLGSLFEMVQSILKIDNKDVSMDEIERLFFIVLNFDLGEEIISAMLGEYYLIIGDFDKAQKYAKKPKKTIERIAKKLKEMK